MKKLLQVTMIIVSLAGCTSAPYRMSDDRLRQSVVEMHNQVALCTGAAIIAEKKSYIITAGHCSLIITPEASLIDEDGNSYVPRIVKLDKERDLMLLENPGIPPIALAEEIVDHEHVHAMTRGYGFPSHRGDGEVLDERVVKVEDLTLRLLFTTVPVWPGSSGGPVVDSSGRLIGIVSIGGGAESLSGVVPLNTIKSFLEGV